MGTKTLIRLAAVLAVCLVAFTIVKCSSENQGVTTASSDEKKKVIKDFQLNKVSQIKISEKEETLTLKKGSETWEVVERNNYPADTKKVIDLIRSVWDLNIAQTVPLQRNQYGRVQLLDPALAKTDGKEAATVLSFSDGAEDLGTIWLGKKHESSDGRNNPYTGGPMMTDVGRYIKRGDNDLVFIVTETFDSVKAKASDWMDDTFFEVTKIKSIARKTAKPEEDWTLTREKNADEFTLVDAKEGEELGTSKVASMKTAFGNAAFVDLFTGDEAKVPEGNQFTVTTFDGFTYEIATGEKNDLNELPMSMKVSAELPEARTAAEDETEEAKKKADEKFKKDLEKRKTKLAEEKKFEGKVFKIRSFIVDPLNKTRAELMKEEGDSEGGAPAGAGGLPPGMQLPPGVQLPPGLGGQ